MPNNNIIDDDGPRSLMLINRKPQHLGDMSRQLDVPPHQRTLRLFTRIPGIFKKKHVHMSCLAGMKYNSEWG